MAMNLRFLHKTRLSGAAMCPAVYRAENGNYVFQGWPLDAETMANLRDLAPGEIALEVPADVVDRLFNHEGGVGEGAPQ